MTVETSTHARLCIEADWPAAIVAIRRVQRGMSAIEVAMHGDHDDATWVDAACTLSHLRYYVETADRLVDATIKRLEGDQC